MDEGSAETVECDIQNPAWLFTSLFLRGGSRIFGQSLIFHEASRFLTSFWIQDNSLVTSILTPTQEISVLLLLYIRRQYIKIRYKREREREREREGERERERIGVTSQWFTRADKGEVVIRTIIGSVKGYWVSLDKESGPFDSCWWNVSCEKMNPSWVFWTMMSISEEPKALMNLGKSLMIHPRTSISCIFIYIYIYISIFD